MKEPNSLEDLVLQSYRVGGFPSLSRIVNKAGDKNVVSRHLPDKSGKFLNDIVTTLVETQWRWMLLAFFLAFFLCWLFFAALFYVIGWAHGDLEFDENGRRLGEGREECVRGAVDFTGFLLLSIEQQVSTGYGIRYPTEECPEAIFLLIVQLMLGAVIHGAMVGAIYWKAIRPPKYATLKFSHNAVICQRDGKLCLIFRVADYKQEHSIDTKLRAYLFEEKITGEGERAGKIQQRLKLESNGRLFLIWPQTVCHYIDESSPFYDMSARDLLERKFEIVLALTGVNRNTVQVTHARTSYLSSEVLWGHRFSNLVSYNWDKDHYVTYDDHLDDIEQVATILCSARQWDAMLVQYRKSLRKKKAICSGFDELETFDAENGFVMEENDKRPASLF